MLVPRVSTDVVGGGEGSVHGCVQGGQGGRVRGDAAGGGCQGKRRQRREGRQRRAEAVRQGATTGQQAGKTQGVGADHPLQPGDAGMQAGRDTLQGDIDDGRVEDHQHVTQARGGKDPPLGEKGRQHKNIQWRARRRI